jgi:hypothetical protein
MPKLVFIDKEFTGQICELALEKITVGRADDNALVIRDTSVSLHHGELLVHGPEVIVCDLDSSNGIYINGVRVKKQSQVKSGQVVQFGSVAARLELEPESTSDDATAITAVYSLRHLKDKEEREPAKPPSPPAAVKLEPVSPPDAVEHTVIMRRPFVPPQPLVPPASPPSPASPPRRFTAILIALAALVTVGLILAVWLWLGRK